MTEHIIHRIVLPWKAKRLPISWRVYYTLHPIVIKCKQLFRFHDGTFYTMHRIAI